MKIKDLLKFAVNDLRNSNINSASLDAELLLSFVLGKPKEYLYSHSTTECTDSQTKKFQRLIERRKNHEPVSYIIGKKEFYGLDFVVDTNVLIPRPDTELLVELAYGILRMANSKTTVVDLGTGSGNIIVALTKKLETGNTNYNVQGTKYYAIDNSKSALKIAKKNARQHKVNKQITFLHGNLLKPFFKNHMQYAISHKLILVANLPYIKDSENLQEDVNNHEPHSALFAGVDGLKFYKELLNQIKSFTSSNVERLSNIILFLEIDPSQKSSIKKLANDYFKNPKISFTKDLSGKTRVVKITNL